MTTTDSSIPLIKRNEGSRNGLDKAMLASVIGAVKRLDHSVVDVHAKNWHRANKLLRGER